MSRQANNSADNEQSSNGTILNVSVEEMSSELFNVLKAFNSSPTIKQLVDINTHLCRKYSVKNFSEFLFVDPNSDGTVFLDLVAFIYKYRPQIDPQGSLSIYDYVSSNSNHQEAYPFLNQFAIVKNWREKQGSDQSSTLKALLSRNELSAIEKALRYKFSTQVREIDIVRIIKQATSKYQKNLRSIIR